MRLCKCGAIVKDRCNVCYPSGHTRTTKERGYGHDHRKASERYRAEKLHLCEVCQYEGRTAQSRAMHHIVKIADAPWLRMERDNWLAVCDSCHERVEVDAELARKVKAWSDATGGGLEAW